MRTANRFAIPVVALIAAVVVFARADAPPEAEAPAKAEAAAEGKDRQTLEKEFAEAMNGVVLVGRFTMEGQEGEPKEEKYTIESVKKVEGDDWEFTTRIQFLGKDVSVPLVLPVLWAGDTPVITVTDVKIPGMGTYTARVMIYDGQYAGTWSGADHGGHLWGKIRKIGEGEAEGEGVGAEGEAAEGEKSKPKVEKGKSETTKSEKAKSKAKSKK